MSPLDNFFIGESLEFDGFFLLPKRRLQEEEREAGIPDSTGQVDKGTNSVKIDQRAAWKGLARDL